MDVEVTVRMMGKLLFYRSLQTVDFGSSWPNQSGELSKQVCLLRISPHNVFSHSVKSIENRLKWLYQCQAHCLVTRYQQTNKQTNKQTNEEYSKHLMHSMFA